MSTDDGTGGDRDLGQRFEAENAREDIERWRAATDAERARAIAELVAHAERIVAATGARNDAPARRIPTPARRGPAGRDG